MDWIKSLCAAGVTLILVSHDFGVLNSFCTKGLVLDQGRVSFAGSMREALDIYLRSLSLGLTGAFAGNVGLGVLHGKIAQIERVQFVDSKGLPVKEVCFGQKIQCLFSIKINTDVAKLAFMLIVRDKNGYDVACFDSYAEQSAGVLECLQRGEVHHYSFYFPANFSEGMYSLLLGVGDPDKSKVRAQQFYLYDLVLIYDVLRIMPRATLPLRAAMVLPVQELTYYKEKTTNACSDSKAYSQNVFALVCPV